MTSISDLVNEREVVTVPLDASAKDAARTLADEGIGSVVVVDGDGSPVGIVTDRDLAVRVVARQCDVATVGVEEAMSSPLHVAAPDDSIDEVIEVMRRRGIRRLPLVEGGELVGFVSLDSLVGALAREVSDLGRHMRSRARAERQRGQLEKVRRDVDETLSQAYERLLALGGSARDTFLDELRDLRARLAASPVDED